MSLEGIQGSQSTPYVYDNIVNVGYDDIVTKLRNIKNASPRISDYMNYDSDNLSLSTLSRNNIMLDQVLTNQAEILDKLDNIEKRLDINA